MNTAKTRIKNQIKVSIQAYEKMLTHCVDSIEQAGLALVETYYKNGGTVFTFGNGGSAADAQHIADELMCMLRNDHTYESRFPLSAHALTTDSSVLTAIANDLGYDYVFSRQIEALAQPKDLVIGISTSGNSENVIKALEIAKQRGVKSIGMTGRDGGKIAKRRLADILINIPAQDVGIIQQGHVLAFHSMCDIMEEILFSDKGLKTSSSA